MLKDTQTIKRLDEIRLVISNFSKMRADLQKKLASLGLSPAQIKNRSSTIPNEIWLYRDGIVAELKKLEEEVLPIRQKFRELHFEHDQQKNKYVMEVFREIFSDDQRMEIYTEVNRRIQGENPIPTGYNFKDLEKYKNGYYEYKNLATEQMNKMVEFRIMLTGMIEEGCRMFGEAEFLKFISPLNTLIIPVKELKKIKMKMFL
jgi:hypothetical protein